MESRNLRRVAALAFGGLGKRVTAHWRHVDRFTARFPHIRVKPNTAYRRQFSTRTE